MPPKPRWLLAIPDAISQLEKLDRTLLTRRDIERLFGVSTAQGRHPHADLRGRNDRLPENAAPDETPPPAPETPGPVRLPRRRRTPGAAPDRAPEGPADRDPGDAPRRDPRREIGELARGGVGFSGADRGSVSPLHVAAYIRTHPGSVPTVKQHLAAIRMLCDWLVVNQVLPVNPAAAVRGPKHVVTKGATPVLTQGEARKLLDHIDTGTLAGLLDRALFSVMLYSFARVSAVLGMRRQDYFAQGSRGWLRLHEKGGRRHDVPAHHRAAEILDEYVEAAELEEPKAALIQSVDRAGERLTGRPLTRRVVLAMIKRRAAAAGLPLSTCCHTFRATGITAYLSNGGTLEHAQQIAGHASPKTTKLYDRTADTVTVDEIERIVI